MAIWTSGQGPLRFGTGGLLTNTASGTFDIGFDASMASASGGGTFANAGIFRQTAGVNGSTVGAGVAFNNSSTVDVNVGGLTLGGGGSSSGRFNVAGGATLSFNSSHDLRASSIVTGAGHLKFSGGTVGINGEVTIAGTTTILGGQTVVNFNGSPAILGPLLFAEGDLGGANPVTVSGPLNWTGGTIRGNVLATGGLILGGSSMKRILSGRLLNSGLATWSSGSGTLGFGLGGLLTNTPSGTFDISYDASLVNASGGGTFANAGLFRQSGGNNGSTLGVTVAFNNSGTAAINAGGLNLGGGGNSSGLFSVAPGTKLNLAGGTHTLTAASRIEGGGQFEVSAGTANLGGTFTISSTHRYSGGVANFSGNYNIAGASVSVQGGTVNFNGSGIIRPVVLNISSGGLGGANDVIVTGPMTWSGGEINGRVFATAGLSVSGSDKTLTSGRLVNSGVATWTQSSGNLRFGGGGLLTNTASGTFVIGFDASMVNASGGGTFANAGIVRQSGGLNGSTVGPGVAFNNSSIVEVNAGGLSLGGGGSSSGRFNVAGGSTLSFNGSHNLGPGSSVTGAGHLKFTAGTIGINGELNISGTTSILGGLTVVNFNGSPAILGSLLFNADGLGGTLGGTSDVNVTGPMTWSGGTISGSVSATGGLSLGGSVDKRILSGRLLNSGLATWASGSGTLGFGLGALLTNTASGTFEISYDAALVNASGGGTFANAGLFRQSAGVKGSTFGPAVAFSNSGTVKVQAVPLTFDGGYSQTAGLTLLEGGNITNSFPLRILGGTLAGTNFVAGSLTNGGSVDPGGAFGKLTVTEAYTQTTDGALNIEVGGTSAGTDFDLLAIGRTAVLAGTLNVTLTNGYYPPTNDVLTFLTCTNRIGTFTTVTYPTDLLDSVEVIYTPTNASLKLVPLDIGTAPPFLWEPGEGTVTAGNILVAYGLPETALPGSVNLIFDDGTIQRTLVLRNSERGPEPFRFDSANPASAPEIASGVPIPDGTYSVILSHQDAAGNRGSTTNVNVTVDTVTQVPTLTEPASNSAFSGIQRPQPVSVLFTLPEAGAPQSVKLLFNDGVTARELMVRDSRAGQHRFLLQPENPSGSGEVAATEPIPNGIYSVTLSYRDALGNPPASAMTTNVTIITCSQIVIMGPLPPFGRSTAGISESRTLTAVGGTAPYIFSVAAGTLPEGWTLSSAGVLSGTPTKAGTFTFTLRATDAWGCSGDQSYTQTVLCPDVALSPTILADLVVGHGFGEGGADGTVRALAVQADGGVLVGGSFTYFKGAPRTGLARLNADGSLDPDFAPSLDGSVFSIALQPDGSGRICIGGTFTTVNEVSRNNIARLEANGTLDASFDPGTGATGQFELSKPIVFVVVVQPDGRLIIGGVFTHFNGTRRQCLARLNTDGRLDQGFNASDGPDKAIVCIALEPDGQMIIGGLFTQFNGVNRNRIARLDAEGRLDFTIFNHGLDIETVKTIGIQSDRKIVLGGFVNSIDGPRRTQIARVNRFGERDRDFNPTIEVSPALRPNPNIQALAIQPDDKIVIGGLFHTVDFISRGSIARLNADGSLDQSFNPGTGATGSSGPEPEIAAVTLQSDRKVLIGGAFTQVDGISRNRIARLNSNGRLEEGYSQAITATGGTAPYSFTIPPLLDPLGPQPLGLKLSSDGLLSGTPIMVGTFSFEISVKDANGCIGNQSYTLRIHCPPILVRPGSLRPAPVGVRYHAALTALSGSEPYDFAVTAGTLPPGLTLSSAGLLSGTPTISGNYSFTVRAQASNDARCSGSETYTLVVAAHLLAPSRQEDGSVILTLEVEPGRPHTIEYSADLVNWVELVTATSEDGSMTVTDPDAPAAVRYYRAFAR